MAKLLKPDGTETEITPANNKSFQLDELYKLLECDVVEVVRLPNNQILIVDEEGKLRLKKPNFKATILIHDSFIVGNAILCKSSQFK